MPLRPEPAHRRVRIRQRSRSKGRPFMFHVGTRCRVQPQLSSVRFSANGTVDCTSAQTLLPVTVTLLSGPSFSGTIQLNQGSFNNTNGASVPLSQYGANNGLLVVNAGTFLPASSNRISVTCASGGSLNQACTGNFTASFLIQGTVAASPAPVPIPSTLILAVSGTIFALWMLRRSAIRPAS